MMKKWTIMLSAALLLCGWESVTWGQKAQPLGGKAQQSVIELANGDFVRGWVLRGEGGKKEFIPISGEKIELPAKPIVHKIPDLEKEFAKMQRDVRNKEDDRTAKYIEVLDWGRDRQLYEAVEALADKLVKRSPANPDPKAQQAHEWAKAQLDLMAKTRAQGADEGEWTMERIQKIRFALVETGVYEGSNPQIAFRGNVLDRFLQEMASQEKYQSRDVQRDFLRLPALEQVKIIKNETGFKYQPDITINRDPRLILDFRSRVQPLLTRSCAQPSCHGGTTTKLQLSARATSIPQLYANYYALDTYRSESGNVIDHVRPEVNSLLINYLLPPDLAPGKLAHTPKIPPAIRTLEDPRYLQLVDWLRAQPKESIDVLLGETPSATQPAETKRGGAAKPSVSNKETAR